MILFALGQARMVLVLDLPPKGLIPFRENIFHINTSYNPYPSNVGRHNRLGPKRTISYHLGRNVTYGIRAIAQPEMGERAQAHRGRQRGRWVLRGGDCDVPHCLGMDYMMCLYRICSL
jgi:hypothetical protein